MTRRGVTRRGFISMAASAAAAPYVITSQALGQGAVPPASERVTLGHIGVGGQGSGLLRGFIHQELCQSVATCDPFKDRRENWAKHVEEHYSKHKDQGGSYEGCTPYEDFRELLDREDIDAVVIATPDHWHIPIAVAAVRAGKDIYVEKPLGVSIEQNKALRQEVERYGAIFQYGTQQRCFNTHCAFACELVRNGYIGELKRIDVIAPDGAIGGDPTPQQVPEGLHYDLWLGPAPVTPYTHDKVVGTGRYHCYDYSLGFIAGWGAHPLDIAHWGYPQIPVVYEGTGFIPTEGLFDTVVHWDVKGTYASGVSFTLKPGSDKTTFVGTEGQVAASRGGIRADPPSLLQIELKPGDERLLQDNHHYRNFLQAVKTRSAPVSDIASACQSDFISHLGNIAIRTGREIHWDPETETIIGDDCAQRMQIRSLRPPWCV